MVTRKKVAVLLAMASLLIASFQLYASDTLSTWKYNTTIILNTSSTGANTTTTQHNFPVLIRLTSINAAAVFATAQSNGGDLRFSHAGDTGQLPYELNKYNQASQTAIIWVKADSVQGNNVNQAIRMWWGKSSAATTSDSANVFVPANGFAMVLHLNKLSSSTTLYDATGQGNNGTPSGTVTDTTGVFDRAVAVHCYGTSTSYLAGDSITVASLLGDPAQVTMSAWVRVDSIDQANTGGNGHLGCIMSMGDYASMNDAGGTGTGTDSLCTGWFGSGTQWNNYGWPTQSESGNSINGYPNASGMACLHQGWRHVAIVINPTAGYTNIYYNGDSVVMVPATNALAWTGGNNGVRTVFGKHGGGHAGLKLGGSICEARIDNVARSSDWIRLCYQNQQPGDSLVIMNTSTVPVLVSPTNGTTGLSALPTLIWNAYPGAASYTLMVSTASNFSTTVLNTTIGTDYNAPSGLVILGNMTYYWQVMANTLPTSTGWSSVWSFTTGLLPPMVSSPTNGTLNVPVTTTLNWYPSNGATSYSIMFGIDPNWGSTIFTQSGITATSLPLNALTNNTNYVWRLNASNATLTSQWSANWTFITAAAPPTPPNLSSPSNGASVAGTSATLNWAPTEIGATYQLEISTSSTFATTVIDQTNLIAVTSFAVTGLKEPMTYFWQMNATLNSVTSAWTAPWSFKTVATAVSSEPGPAAKTDFAVRSGVVTYSLVKPGAVELSFSDMLGRKALVVDKMQAAGRYSLAFKNLNLAPGLYLVRFKAGGIEKIQTIMLER